MRPDRGRCQRGGSGFARWRHPRRNGSRDQRSHWRRAGSRQRREGNYQVTDLAPGQYRVEAALDGFETGVRRGAVDGRQTAQIDVTLTPARLTEGVVVTARRVEEAVQEVPIPVSVLSGQLVESAGAFNVNRVKELIPTVQFYSSNPRNSVGHHPRHGLAVRPDQRRHRAGRRPLHRRRVLRAPGRGDARLPRRRAGRSAARTAGHALRQEHDGRRDQRHEPPAELLARERTSRWATAATTSSRPKPRSPVRSAARSRGASRSRAPAAMASSTTPRTQENTNTLNNLGFRGQLLVAPSKTLVDQRRCRSHAAAARRLRAGDRGCRADAASGESAVGADRRRPRLHAAELQRVRSSDRHRHAAGGPIRIWAARRRPSIGRSAAAA